HVLFGVLGLLDLGERRVPQLAAEAGLAAPAPLRLGQVGVVVRAPEGAVPQAVRDPLRLPGVLRPDGARQAVDRVVRDLDGLVLVPERLDRDDGPEGLLRDGWGAAAHAVEHGGQVVEPGLQLARAPPPAAADDGAVGDRLLDVRRDLVAVGRGDERAGLGRLVERAAEPDAL